MARIIAFRAWRYNPAEISDLGAVLAPPYDVIDEDRREALYGRHPLNVVRLILGRPLPGDDDGENRYTRAARCLEHWRRKGILLRDDRPALYLCRQTFPGLQGEPISRTGFISLLRLEPLDAGTVFPHEETFPKHKMDRLNLMRATRAHFNPIFSLFPDPEGELGQWMRPPADPPEISVSDDAGVLHEMWTIRDPRSIHAMAQAMEKRPVFIADGHHRYETCLKYQDEVRATCETVDDRAPAGWTMMYLTPMEDEGLVIFPVHKMVRNLDGLAPDRFLEHLGRLFRILEVPFVHGDEAGARARFLQMLREQGETGCAIGLAMAGEPCYRILVAARRGRLEGLLSHLPECLRALDVTLLHEVIFRGQLGIDITDPSDPHLSYLHDAGQCLDRVLRSQVQLAFIMNPTRIRDLESVASSRCKMPQKATYFYPKLLSGLVINIMDPGTFAPASPIQDVRPPL